jgi:hypothetical protein
LHERIARAQTAGGQPHRAVEHGHPKPPEPQQRIVPVGPARPRLRPRPDHGVARLHHPRGRSPASRRAGPVCTNQLGAMPRASDSPAGTVSACACFFGGACAEVWVFVRAIVHLLSKRRPCSDCGLWRSRIELRLSVYNRTKNMLLQSTRSSAIKMLSRQQALTLQAVTYSVKNLGLPASSHDVWWLGHATLKKRYQSSLASPCELFDRSCPDRPAKQTRNWNQHA